MSEIKKLNFAVLRSMFGDLWVGETAKEADGKSIFPTFDEAMDRAMELNDSIENRDELEATEEEDVEELNSEMEKWII